MKEVHTIIPNLPQDCGKSTLISIRSRGQASNQNTGILLYLGE